MYVIILYCVCDLLISILAQVSWYTMHNVTMWQTPAHVWDFPRWLEPLLLIFEIIHGRTLRLSHQFHRCAYELFLLSIINNDFYRMGRSQIYKGACWHFRFSEPRSGTLCITITQTKGTMYFCTKGCRNTN